MSQYHTPVLPAETLEGLEVRNGGIYIDGTLGGGGHTLAIHALGGNVIGIDVDIDAINEVRSRLETANHQSFGNSYEKNGFTIWKYDRLTLVQGNFRDIEAIAKTLEIEKAQGVLLDLGVSSHQLDTESRGFSLRYEQAPLDLRLSKNQPLTASAIVQTSSEEDLNEIFTRFAEENRALSIARAIVCSRRLKPIETIGDFIRATGCTDGRVIARLLQALRIIVNDEMNALKNALTGSGNILSSGGICAVISFHSLEDRIVKREFQKEIWQQVTKRPKTATDDEMYKNSRSRSAKLRIAKRV